ncbi:hypothetical protein [Streptomyces cacaoi]|uniref:hypothetical protein n=1 Tax=Streptomyces cacaoi TaxID=1898 RepID=UPI0037499D14
MFAAETPKPSEEFPTELASRRLERAGRQLFYILEESAPDFAELRTGAPIRTVVRIPSGALLYHSVEAGFHLCCATPQDQVTELIARMTEGIDDLRPAVRYSLLPRRSYLSRYATAAAASVQPPSVEQGSEDDDITEGSPYTMNSATDATAELSGLMRAALGVDGLHYVAYYAAGVPTCTVDIFRHPALRTHFGAFTTPQQRRDKYSLLGQLLPGVTRRMNTSLHALLEGQIHQIVLNMEQGAVYFQHLQERNYLLGISLDHSRPAEADRHIERLGSELTSE